MNVSWQLQLFLGLSWVLNVKNFEATNCLIFSCCYWQAESCDLCFFVTCWLCWHEMPHMRKWEELKLSPCCVCQIMWFYLCCFCVEPTGSLVPVLLADVHSLCVCDFLTYSNIKVWQTFKCEMCSLFKCDKQEVDERSHTVSSHPSSSHPVDETTAELINTAMIKQ